MPINPSTVVVHVHATKEQARADAADLQASAQMTIALFEKVAARVTWDNNVNLREDVAIATSNRPVWLVIAHR